MSAETVTVPAWKLRRAAEILDRDGDEHGVAADLWAMLADHGAPAFDWTPKDPGCWCARFDMEHNVTRTRMSVCDRCGDKRCPRAEDHRCECRKTPNV